MIFKNYIKCLNNDFRHGFFSSLFNIGRGYRQGYPISPYICILCVEILGILIRNCKDIKGIKISNIELKVIQYADDAGLISYPYQLRTSLYDKRDDFNFYITNFPFLRSNIPSSHAYSVFISQLIRYARACSSYECFILRAMRLSSKLLGHGYVKEHPALIGHYTNF